MDSHSLSGLAFRPFNCSFDSSDTRRRAIVVRENVRRSRWVRVIILLAVLRASCGRMAGMK